MKSNYEFLFVGRDEGSFVECYAYDLGDTNGGGRIFINLEIQNNPIDAEAIGEVIFDSMRKAFYADLDKDAYGRFEDAVKAVNKSLAQVKAENATSYIGNLNVLIAAIKDDGLYLTQCGEAEAYLIRKRLCTNVSEGLQDEQSTEVFTNIASGTIEPGDMVLLSSTRLYRYISKNDLARVASGKNLVASLGELKEYLSGEVLSKIGVVGVSFAPTAPELSPTEKVHISTHLEKEEVVYSGMQKAGSSSRIGNRSVKVLKDSVVKLTSAISGLRKKMMVRGERQIRAEMNNSGSIAGFKLPSNWDRNQVMVSTVAIVILLFGVIWWIRGKALEQQTISKYAQTLTQVQDEIASAETTGQYNKDQAGQMLAHAQQQALDVLNSGYNRQKANELLQQIQDTRAKLDGVFHPQTTVLVDLSQKRQNVSALGLLSEKGTLFAFEYNALYPIIADKLQDVFTIDDNETVISGTPYDDQGSVLFFTKSGKVIEYKDGRVSFVDTTDAGFHKGIQAVGYSNKLYILDPSQNQIWRYTRRRDKFDGAAPYNVDGDLKNAVAMTIDGSVYILNKDGTVTKLFGGSKVDFSVKKQPVNPPTNPTKIFTQLDMSNIYIVEPSTKRVFVYTKDEKDNAMAYVNQYVFDDIPDIRDIYVDKDTNTMYLLDGTKVYKVTM